MKRSVILTDRLGPNILLVLTMKRQVLHRERVQSSSFVSLITNHLPHIWILFLFTEHVSPDRTAQMRMIKCKYLKFMLGGHCARR